MQGRPLLPKKLELFKKVLGIGPYNFWRWSSRTRLTNVKVVWVDGKEENKGKARGIELG